MMMMSRRVRSRFIGVLQNGSEGLIIARVLLQDSAKVGSIRTTAWGGFAFEGIQGLVFDQTLATIPIWSERKSL